MIDFPGSAQDVLQTPWERSESQPVFGREERSSLTVTKYVRTLDEHGRLQSPDVAPTCSVCKLFSLAHGPMQDVSTC